MCLLLIIVRSDPLVLAAVYAEGSVDNPLAEEAIFPDSAEGDSTLSITVVGASGDLAKKKIFPALFALYYEDWLPEVVPLLGIIGLSSY